MTLIDLPFSAAADRNKDPILAVLQSVLPATGTVLEIASGTGQHVCHFAKALSGIHWQPTEPDEASRQSLSIRVREAGLRNVAPPEALDVLAGIWPVAGQYDAVLCINMIHISPWPATAALLRGAAQRLVPQGKLVLYGPFFENGTAVPSNLEFDASLKRRNPDWGLRSLEEVTRLAGTFGLRPQQVTRMPANNLTVVFSRD
jgi:SAM-dependent methyltransferase